MKLFRMNFGQKHLRLAEAGVVLATTALVAGCGNNYRSVITPITPSGPAGQVTSYAVVVSAPSTDEDGIATIVDYSGDTIMAQANTGLNPTTLAVDEAGSYGYTINSDGTITNFPISTSLKQKLVTTSTVPTNAAPLNLFAPSSGLWAPYPTGSLAYVFSGTPKTLEASIPVASTPVMIAGPSTVGQRDFAISQNISSPTGMECNISPTTAPYGKVTPIEVSSETTDAAITVGRCPVYAVESSNTNSNGSQRLFVLNRGSDTISVINTEKGALNTCTPFTDSETGRTVTCHSTLPLSTASLTSDNAPVNCNITSNPTCGLPTVAGPVYAEYNAATSQLVVANYDGGTINIIDVSMDVYGNDSSTFGTTYTVSVGNNPASVTALYDGSFAYTANQSDETVSVVNLTSHTVVKTLSVTGHPRTVVSTQNSSYAKVYVASPDSVYLTILNAGGTTANTVDTNLQLGAGKIVDVRVSTQDGESGNDNNVSRAPGYGQPCNLPLSEFDPTTSSEATLANCQEQ